MNRNELEELIKLLGSTGVTILEVEETRSDEGFMELISRVLGSMCGEYRMSDEHERELAEDVAALAKKWLNFEAYPADPSKQTKRPTDPEVIPEGAHHTFTVIARGMSLLHMLGSATSGAAFLAAPEVLQQPIGALFQKAVHHSLEIGLTRASEFKKERKAERRAEREAEAARKHPAAAETGESQKPQGKPKDATKAEAGAEAGPDAPREASPPPRAPGEGFQAKSGWGNFPK